MEFGQIEKDLLQKVNTLLPYSEATVSFLYVEQTNPKGIVHLGASHWNRTDWIGSLYPKGTKERDSLREYSKNFNCVELNSTFYRIYPQPIIERWVAETPEDFYFCPKFPQTITHFKRLKNCEELTPEFLNQVRGFGKKLGPGWIQLPDNFGPNKFQHVKDYFLTLPNDLQFFLEVRHPDWFVGENRDMLYDFLAQNKIGWIITDTSGRRDCVHMELTIPKAFIRFAGNNHQTDYSRIDSWVDRISEWLGAGIEEVYFILHQRDESTLPILAEYAARQFNLKCGLNLPIPHLLNQ